MLGRMEQRTRSWWGWGWTGEAMADEACSALAAGLPGCATDPVPVPEVPELRAPRAAPPAALAGLCTAEPAVRAGHTYGKAFRDVVRALDGDLSGAPDVVVLPRTEDDVAAVLDWAGDAGVAVVPYGGGSSVVGGTEYRGEGPWVSLDLTRLDRVLEVDATSRAARVQGGTLGPGLEDQLRPHGLTLRHFPQSFEFSTVGGWLATRSGGHYAMGPTHVDDVVESLRVVTPVGVSESWRLPASGAGPSPDRLFLGSEGALGVITEAWLRVQRRPEHRASAAVRFVRFPDALAAVREIAQSGVTLANCRLLDHGEAHFSGAASGGHAVLVLGAESAHGPVDVAGPLEIALAHGGVAEECTDGRDGAVASWRSAFLRMPYLRDGLARCGAIVETFETACTWDTADVLVEAVRTEVGAAAREVCGVDGIVNCRLTHLYPDGPAPYFTVLAGGRPGMQLGAWDEIRAAATEVLGRHRATITHHHAVGRDHRPGYDRQRPDLFAASLRAVKAVLDPRGVLNPGVLV
ncbi:FAD-binding oxidoreductase [Pseudonocardia broussonetiae]|uniref:FAD-binding oxidoreductase n=2 Tax=Pseudonocardia broussonetiae TaxID=2736640 RepID=A0A6M6JFS5_9PSEU|nr:FAD-binding oxidoreductase [Pseudonocardia broussonetiae]